MNKIKSVFLTVSLALLCLCFLLFSPELSKGIANGIFISLQTLIPSMFAFITLTDFIGNSGCCKVLAAPFSAFFKHVLKLDTELASIFLLSAIGGYPAGALLIESKLKSHQITLEAAQFMLRFCILPSPAFLIAAVSQNLWQTKTVGAVIYFSQIIAALIIAFVGRFSHEFYHCKNPTKSQTSDNPQISSIFVSSVRHGISAMSMICGFVIIFCGGFALLDLLNLPQNISLMLKAVLEVTSGCQMIHDMSFTQSALFVTAITAFGGLCVHLQIISILRNYMLSLPKFFFWRICFALLSTLISIIAIRTLSITAPCFTSTTSYSYKLYSVSPSSSVFLLILGFMLLSLSFSQNCAKIK